MRDYFSLVTFSHTVFALPFALIGFSLAVLEPQHSFQWFDLLLVVGCMVFARNAAMAFNRLADAKYDVLNERTVTRDIPAGRISVRRAGVFIGINCTLFCVCAGFLNATCLWLSPIALAVILGYSYTKRFTWLCHVVLGVGLALAPIGAYIAVAEQFSLVVVLLGLAVLLWVAGFDVLYALQDRSFDAGLGLNSIPTRFGESRSFVISRSLHVLCFCALGFASYFMSLFQPGASLWIGLALVVFTSALLYQHTLVAPGQLDRIDRAFFTTNGMASVLYATVLLAGMFLLQ